MSPVIMTKQKKQKQKQIMTITIKNLVSPQKRKSWTWRKDLCLPDGRGREWEGSGAWSYQTQLRIDLQGDPAE